MIAKFSASREQRPGRSGGEGFRFPRRQFAIGGEVGECGAVSAGPPVNGTRDAVCAQE
jgi:hypothetical protein